MCARVSVCAFVCLCCANESERVREKESEQEESYLRSTDTRQGFWGSLALMQCTYRVDLDCITISYCHGHDSVGVTLIRFISDR